MAEYMDTLLASRWSYDLSKQVQSYRDRSSVVRMLSRMSDKMSEQLPRPIRHATAS